MRQVVFGRPVGWKPAGKVPGPPPPPTTIPKGEVAAEWLLQESPSPLLLAKEDCELESA